MGFFAPLLFVVALVLGAVNLFYYVRLRKMTTPPDIAALRPEPLSIGNWDNVEPGMALRLDRAFDDAPSLVVNVVARTRYTEPGYHWWEFECVGDGRHFFLEIEHDEELYASLTLKKISPGSIEGLGDTAALSVLAAASKLGDTGRFDKSVTYDGKTFNLSDQGQATWYGDEAEEFRYIEYESADGEEFVSLEIWSDNSTEAFYGIYLDASQITVYR